MKVRLYNDVDACLVPLAAFTEKSPVNQKNLFSRRFFVLEGNIAGYWCDINTVRVVQRTEKGDDEGCSH